MKAVEPVFSSADWLRVGLLLFIAQALALSLQAVLLVHKERDLLVGITISRVALAADQVQAHLSRASATGLVLAEASGIRRLLPRLLADDPEIAAIEVLDAASGGPLFEEGEPFTAAASAREAILADNTLWSHFADGQSLQVGRRLVDGEEGVVGAVLISVRAEALARRLQDARAATLPRLATTLAGLAIGLPLLLVAAARLGAGRLALRRRLLAAALLLAIGSSSALGLLAAPSFVARLAPALEAKAAGVAAVAAGRIQAALALGIPFERLAGVEAYFDEVLAAHPEVLSLRLEGPGRTYARTRAGNPGSAVSTAVHDPTRASAASPPGRLVAATDAGVIRRELQGLALDLTIVFLAAVLLFNEALGAILTGPRLAAGNALAGLGRARFAVFLLILSEELTRAFLPLQIAHLARAAGESGPLAVSLPISLYMASFALLTPFAGHWAQRFGSARTFAFGTLLSALGFAGVLAGGDYMAFIAARCVCAAGYAIGTLAMQQAFLQSADPSERTRALALFVGAVQTAAICGAPVGGLLAEQFGSAAVFAGAAASSLLALAVQRFDHRPAPTGGAAASGHLLPLLRRRSVLLPLLSLALPAKLALAGFLFYLVPLALQQEGFSSGSTGRAMMMYFLLVAAANPLASWLADRFGWQRSLVLLGGLVIGGGGLAGLAGGSTALFTGILALGLGTGLSAAALQAILGREGSGAIVLLRTVERLGAVIGPLLAGSLLTVAAYGGVMATLGGVVVVATLIHAFVPSGERKTA